MRDLAAQLRTDGTASACYEYGPSSKSSDHLFVRLPCDRNNLLQRQFWFWIGRYADVAPDDMGGHRHEASINAVLDCCGDRVGDAFAIGIGNEHQVNVFRREILGEALETIGNPKTGKPIAM